AVVISIGGSTYTSPPSCAETSPAPPIRIPEIGHSTTRPLFNALSIMPPKAMYVIMSAGYNISFAFANRHTARTRRRRESVRRAGANARPLRDRAPEGEEREERESRRGRRGLRGGRPGKRGVQGRSEPGPITWTYKKGGPAAHAGEEATCAAEPAGRGERVPPCHRARLGQDSSARAQGLGMVGLGMIG